jgi:hypothetical protein
MANSSIPIRVDAELLETAKVAGSRQSRSAAQQIAHWARLGREVEASGRISARTIDAVLSGRKLYDALHAEEQAMIRAEWANQLDAVADGIDLESEFAASGRHTWVDIADDGTIVHRHSAAHRP